MAGKTDHQHGDYPDDPDSSDSWQTVSQYHADSESSDTWETISPSPPPSAKMRSSRKSSKSPRVTIHTPSEEDLHQRYDELRGRRPPTPYAYSRHSTPQDEEDRKPRKSPKQDHPATDSSNAANTAANTAANSGHPAPSNAPAGTAPQLGPNQFHTHGAPGQPCVGQQPFVAGQPFIPGQQAPFLFNTTSNFAPYPTSINQPGQAPPFSGGHNNTMAEGYQNAFPYNNGIHFQPQVPDTSLGPMTHTYQPRFDNGCVAFTQPGIVVCPPSSFVAVPPPTMAPLPLAPLNPVRPVTFAPQPLVVAPAVAPVMPTLIASAPVYTTLGYKSDENIVAPRVVAGPQQCPQQYAVHMHNGQATAPIMPVVAQQPYPPQPMLVGAGPPVQGPPMMLGPGGVPPGQPVLVHGGPAPMGMGGPTLMPGNYPTHPAQYPVHYEPATGIGQTAGEVAAAAMMNPELNQAQDFEPKDKNPSRMYMVRQLDGNYIQMSRATIDHFGKACRWYVTDDGVFYAVRFEEV